MTEEQNVLVTGASGFIATHVVQQLQQLGYRVRGTVRSTANQQKVQPLKELCPEATYPLELVEADLMKEAGWKEAVSGCQYVIHTASPFPAENPRDENEIIKPAVDGTLFVLRACKEVGGVKRVVLTSSVAAIANGTVGGEFSEKDWTDVDKTASAYYKSKTLAEKAAWDFVAELADEEKFELAIINPGYVVGPVLCGGIATSMEIPKRLLQKEMPMLPKLNMACVDVRDVAKAHVNAMTVPEAAGNRHILSAGSVWMKEMAAFLDEEFKPLGYKVPLSEAPHFLLKIMGLFDKGVKGIVPLCAVVSTFDNRRMKSVLDIEPRDIKTALVDMGYSMIQRGIVKKTKKYIEVKEAPST